MHGCCAKATLATLLGVLILAPGAEAVVISTSVSPPRVSYFGRDSSRTTKVLRHRLVWQSESQAERWLIDVPIDTGNSPLIGQFARFEGAPQLTVEGPAVLSAGYEVAASSSTRKDALLHSGRDRCPTPVARRIMWRHELTIYPDTTSTVILPRRLALTHAPPDGTLYAQTWVITPVASDGHPNFDGQARVMGATPGVAGLEPSRLDLRVRQRGSSRRVGAGELLTSRVGRRFVVSGSLTPVLRRERVTIWRYAPRQTKARKLAVVRTDSLGRFVYRGWRPRRTGRWELYATYGGQPGFSERTRSPCGGPKVDVVSIGYGD